MKALNILAVSDQRPGHVKQTESIIKSLSDLTPIERHYQNVGKTLTSDLRAWGRAILSMTAQPIEKLQNLDIVIGTGSHTHAKVIESGNRHCAKKIICMSPPSVMGPLFDLCFIPEHDAVVPRDNYFFTVGPPNLSKNMHQHDDRKGLILIGGVDEKSHTWRSEEIADAIVKIIDREPGLDWTISTSPRTPEHMNQLLTGRLKDRRYVFLPFDQTPPYWIEGQYAASRYVWVTADSMSMVYEAISAGCSVGLIPVAWKRHDNKFAISEKNLIRKQYVTSFEHWILERGFPENRREIDESLRCAQEILRRWWPERLP